MAWTDIPAYVLDQIFGFQDANKLRENSIALKDVPFIVKSASAPSNFLPNVQAMNALASGYVKNTAGTGVLTVTATIPAADIVGSIPPGTHATVHNTGGSDPITALSAAVLTTGTIDPLRLPMRYEAMPWIISHYDSPGSAIATGVAGFLPVACDFTLTDVTLLSVDAAATSGSIVVDIWRDTYANFPPTVTDTIFGGTKPSITSASKGQLSGLSIALTRGQVLGFNVDSVASLTRVLIQLSGYYY